MREPGDFTDARIPPGLGISRRSLFRGLGVCVLMVCVAVMASVWFRGASQAARVAEFLQRHEDASIQAQYGAYQYEPPPGMREPVVPGMLTLVLGRGQRVIGFGVADDIPRSLEWLVPVLGEHCFARVTDIHVNNERFSDADIDLLLAFPNLKAVDLSYTAITDVGLAKLTSGLRLVQLDISGTRVSAAGLRRLADCQELKELRISDTLADDDEQIKQDLQQALPECWIR